MFSLFQLNVSTDTCIVSENRQVFSDILWAKIGHHQRGILKHKDTFYLNLINETK